jgi:GT2 family glycosyltransferase
VERRGAGGDRPPPEASEGRPTLPAGARDTDRRTRLSVVIPTTRPDTLARALGGVAAQTAPVDVEVVLVCDGEPFAPAGAWPFPIRTLGWRGRRGVAAAWNAGAGAAAGELLAFCDDDDRWHPDHLTASLARLAAGCGAVHGAATVVDEGTGRRHPFHFPLDASVLRHTNPLMFSTAVMRRESWERVGPFDVSLPHYADWDWAIRSCDAGVAWGRVPHATVDYHWNSALRSNTSAGGDAVRAAELDRLRAKHGLGPLRLATFFTMATDPWWDRWRLPEETRAGGPTETRADVPPNAPAEERPRPVSP